MRSGRREDVHEADATDAVDEEGPENDEAEPASAKRHQLDKLSIQQLERRTS